MSVALVVMTVVTCFSSASAQSSTADTAPDQTPARDAAAPAARSADWTRKLALGGFIQAQLVSNEKSDDGIDAQGRPQNARRFEIRRGRVKLTFRDDPVEGVLHVDATQAGLKLLDAEVSAKLGWHGDAYTKLTAGLFRIPFGYELQESTSTLPWPERSIAANRMFPGVRDLGARVWGAAWAEKLIYQLAVQNGQPLSDAAFPGLDPNAEKDFTGRLGTKLGVVRAGISGLLGTGYLAPAEDDATTEQDEAHDAIDYARWALGSDLVVSVPLAPLGELGLFGEVVYAKNLDRLSAAVLPSPRLSDAGDATSKVVSKHQLGFYAGAQQALGTHFAAGVRYDRFDPDTGVAHDALSALTLVAHAFPVAALRLTLAYEARFERPQVDDDQLWVRAQLKY